MDLERADGYFMPKAMHEAAWNFLHGKGFLLSPDGVIYRQVTGGRAGVMTDWTLVDNGPGEKPSLDFKIDWDKSTSLGNDDDDMGMDDDEDENNAPF